MGKRHGAVARALADDAATVFGLVGEGRHERKSDGAFGHRAPRGQAELRGCVGDEHRTEQRRGQVVVRAVLRDERVAKREENENGDAGRQGHFQRVEASEQDQKKRAESAGKADAPVERHATCPQEDERIDELAQGGHLAIAAAQDAERVAVR